MAKKIDLDGLEHFKAKENASIAGTESSSTASKAYKVGEYFYFKGTLVVCIVDIPSGGTITLNTNCKTVPLAEAVSELKTAIANITGNLTGSASVISGLYINTSGKIATDSPSAKKLICVNAETDKTYMIKKSTSTIMRAGCGASENLGNNSQLSSYSGHTNASAGPLYVTTDSTNHYIYIQLFVDSDSSSLKSIGANIGSLVIVEDIFGRIEDLEEKVESDNASLTEAIVSVEDNYATKVDETHSTQTSTNYDPEFTAGAVIADGSVKTGSTYTDTFEYTTKIPVEEGDSVLLVNSGSPTPQCRYLCAYYNNTVVSSAGSNSGTNAPYIVPSGVNYVVLTAYKEHHCTAVKVTKTTSTIVTRYFPIEQELGHFSWRGDIGASTQVSLLGSNVKHDVVWAFSGNISTVGKISIGIKPSGDFKELCSVDSTKVYYRSTASGTIASVNHGLTIADDLGIKIVEGTKINELDSITIMSGGEEYTVSVTAYATDMNGVPMLISDGAVMTDCSFSWIPKNIDKPIWVFGDSWVSIFDTRWTYYMVQAGFNKTWLLNGYAGENTETGMVALKNLLSIRKPEYIVWLYGMNNGDTSSAVNTAWKTAYDELIEICDDYKITPILYTVPNTPTINNTYKNAIVEASGYRYIDGVAAVGDDGSGNWITGYEQSESDHNHTSAKGAKALFYRILADFPEIAGNGL